MTKEEAKKMGATHYCNGEYYQWSDDDRLFRFEDDDWFWEDYFLDDWIKPI